MKELEVMDYETSMLWNERIQKVLDKNCFKIYEEHRNPECRYKMFSVMFDNIIKDYSIIYGGSLILFQDKIFDLKLFKIKFGPNPNPFSESEIIEIQ